MGKTVTTISTTTEIVATRDTATHAELLITDAPMGIKTYNSDTCVFPAEGDFAEATTQDYRGGSTNNL